MTADMKTKILRTLFTFAFALTAAGLSTATTAAPAFAVCGDGEVDPGELCDDGNTADGDCCTSTCQFPGPCYTTDRASIIFRDMADDRIDKIFWKYMRGPNTFDEWGDPTDETGYWFCVWDDLELKLASHIEPGGICHPQRPCWKILQRGPDPQAYFYFNKPSNSWGVNRLHLASQKPPTNGFISLRSIGVDINPPGPVGFDKYFNTNFGVTVQFHRDDAPVCWESVFTRVKKNIFKRYKSILTPND